VKSKCEMWHQQIRFNHLFREASVHHMMGLRSKFGCGSGTYP
jgi:hypothetical protein